MTATTTEAVVVGGGPTGLVMAVALATAGVETVLAAPPPREDTRTTALFSGSVTALETLGVWNACRAQAAPLRVMRIIDDTGRLWRAPEVRFAATEIGLEAFGYNIENRHLVAALAAHAAGLPRLTVAAIAAEAVEPGPDDVRVRLANGDTLVARLVVGADGRQSLCRQAAGIVVDSRAYPQTALTVNLAHGRPHRDISTEFHTPTGPFTLVPLPGQRSSLVCVLRPAEAEALAAAGDAALSAEVERRSHSILGKVAVEPGRGLFPLRVEIARQFAGNRVALVGEAGHVIPPIGAQGLNLGLRDAAMVGEIVAQAGRDGRDIGDRRVTDRYDAERRRDIAGRSAAIDLLNRSLLSGFLPVQSLRGLGLYALDRIGPLRRALMREGVEPAASQPRLMRGEAL